MSEQPQHSNIPPMETEEDVAKRKRLPQEPEETLERWRQRVRDLGARQGHTSTPASRRAQKRHPYAAERKAAPLRWHPPAP